MSPLRAVRLTLLLGIACLQGCAGNQPPAKMIQSENPLDRARGCKLAGRCGDVSVAPLLVDRLEDPDPAVRFCANQALRELTKQEFHYRESDPPDARAGAVARWRDYVNGLLKRNGGG